MYPDLVSLLRWLPGVADTWPGQALGGKHCAAILIIICGMKAPLPPPRPLTLSLPGSSLSRTWRSQAPTPSRPLTDTSFLPLKFSPLQVWRVFPFLSFSLFFFKRVGISRKGKIADRRLSSHCLRLGVELTANEQTGSWKCLKLVCWWWLNCCVNSLIK